MMVILVILIVDNWIKYDTRTYFLESATSWMLIKQLLILIPEVYKEIYFLKSSTSYRKFLSVWTKQFLNQVLDIACFLWHMNSLCRFLLPATLIVINDIGAYFFGFFFGRTPLIKLSPKKTWEGFIGASVTTIISAFLVSKISDLMMLMQLFFLVGLGMDRLVS